WSFNLAAAALGPVWTAARRLWEWAFAFTIIELVAVALLATGAYGPLGQAERAQAQRLAQFAAARQTEADQAKQSKAANAPTLAEPAKALKAGPDEADQKADEIAAGRSRLVMEAVALLVLSRLAQAFLANWLLHRKFQNWMTNPQRHARHTWPLALVSMLAVSALYALAA